MYLQDLKFMETLVALLKKLDKSEVFKISPELPFYINVIGKYTTSLMLQYY